jgi:hypothetical protein
MRKQRITVAALAAAMSFCVAVGAQTSTPAEPEYVNQFFVLGSNGQLTPLEGEPMHHAIKHNSIPIIKALKDGRMCKAGYPRRSTSVPAQTS